MAKQNTIVADFKGKVDFGIITIREDEYEAILQRLPLEQLVFGSQTYAISRLKTINEDEYLIAIVRCLEQGNGEGQVAAHNLITELDPQWLLLVGIAGSLPAYEYTLGDVLLASRIHDFCVSARIQDKDGVVSQEFAVKGGPMHPKVQNILSALQAIEPQLDRWNAKEAITVARPLVKISPRDMYGDQDWKKKVRGCLDHYFGKNPIRQHPRVFTGPVASSDTLVKDTDLVKEWARAARQINGIEMELAGVYNAAYKPQKPVLAIRGISDIVGFRRSPEWTSYACHTAAAFTVALLRYRPIIPRSNPDPQQEEGKTTPAPKSQPVGIFKERPPNVPPIPKAETLYSNLLEVSYFPDKLYTVQTKYKKHGQIWAALQEMEFPYHDWAFKGDILYAFHDFSKPIWKDICELETVEEQDTRHWSETTNQDQRNIFIELLGGCLNELAFTRDIDYIHKAWVAGRKRAFKYLCYAPTSTFTESSLFHAEDIKNLARFVDCLKNDDTKITKHIVDKLTAKGKSLLNRYPKVSEDALISSLVNCLNKLLRQPLYKTDLFDEIYLRKHTHKLLDIGPSSSEEKLQVNRMLLEDAYKAELVKRIFAPRTKKELSIDKAMPREVFGAHFSNTTGNFRYYRHNAFRYQFINLGGKWYLEITPTYHYTNDGYAVFRFYEDEIKGIKQQEYDPAVRGQVIFWSRILKGPKPKITSTTLFKEEKKAEVKEYPYIRFGDLHTEKIGFGVIDQAWADRNFMPKIGRSASRKTGRSRKPPEEPKISHQSLLDWDYED